MMTREFFAEVFDRRLALTREVMGKKNSEYATEANPMHNFDRASELLRQSPEKCLLGFLTKHLISVFDMASADIDMFLPTTERVEEKIGDSINYLILLEAMLKQRIYKEDPHPRCRLPVGGECNNLSGGYCKTGNIPGHSCEHKEWER